MDLRDEVRTGHHTFGITAHRQPEGHDVPASVVVEFTGADQDARVVVEGSVLVAVEALGDTAQFLARTLDGLATLHGARPRAHRRLVGPAAPNAGQPWTEDLNEQLREHWLARSVDAPATEIVGELAREFGRTRTSLRAQLARIGCDPDVPGRLLTRGPDG